MDLHEGLLLHHPDHPDVAPGQIARTAEHRQKPFRVHPLVVAHREPIPARGAEFLARAGLRPLAHGDRDHILGRGAGGAEMAQHGGGQLLGLMRFQKPGDGVEFLGRRGLDQRRFGQQTFLIAGQNILGRRRPFPGHGHLRLAQQPLGLGAHVQRHDNGRQPLAPGPAGAARAVQKPLAVHRQIGVNHQLQPRQVDAARGHIGRDADPRPAIAHHLQRARAFVLRQLPRQRHDRKAPVQQLAGQMRHRRPGRAEDDGAFGLVQAQQVDDGIFAVRPVHQHAAIVDIGMALARGHGGNPLRLALEGLRQPLDLSRDGRRKHQRATGFGRGFQNEFQIFAKAHVKHLVGLVQDDRRQRRQIQRTAADMVANPPGRAHNDMRAAFQRPALGAGIHAAHGAGDHRAGLFVKPAQLAADLHGQFPRRRHHQRAGQIRIGRNAGLAQQFRRDRQPEGHRLARPRLRRDQQVPSGQLGARHRVLNGRQGIIAPRGQSLGQRRGKMGEVGHMGGLSLRSKRSPYAQSPQKESPVLASRQISPFHLGSNIPGGGAAGGQSPLPGCLSARRAQVWPKRRVPCAS